MDYDLTRQRIRTAVENADPDISTAPGTITDLIISGAAVPITGLYGYAESIKQAMFADVCSPADLLRHAAVKGVEISEGMADDEIRDMVLRAYRIPPSSADFWSWKNILNSTVKDMHGVGYAIFENQMARGIATVDVVLGHNASPQNLNAVIQAADNFRAFGMADVQCSVADRFDVEIQIKSCGTGVNSNMIKQEILDRYGYGAKGTPGALIYRSRIEAIAVNYGADNAVMRWRETGEDEWADTDGGKQREFIDGKSKYYHTVVTACMTD
jgi:hypothetical protein